MERVDAFCIGASAGGLDACRKLVAGLPRDGGMAFILVQHLDPTHESLMVDLLAEHTPLAVLQAIDGMPIEPDHLYVIPPGTYLSADSGLLRVSEPQARHSARLPFDFLLHSLADEYGERAVAIVLSGTGADGSDGLRAIKEKSGLVVAQDPAEAGYDGMPRSAIATGRVDLVLPVAAMPGALAKFRRQAPTGHRPKAAHFGSADWLPAAVALLRAGTSHDFTLYKEGTLRRRIERRMGLAAIEPAQAERYIDLLRTDPHELDLLAKDLLINVTSFFRDPKVFALLEEKIIPELLKSRSSDSTIRVWVAGCSSGEETYSLLMILREAIEAAQLDVKLQIFASDVDADAIAAAREGLYGPSVAAQISPSRLARFFSKEERGYRVASDLRAAVVFTVQDVLADPPFSRLDMISCRNLLIYLKPEAQAKVLSLFHFALREGGLLLLGNAETAGHVEGRFEVVSKPARVYRHAAHSRPGDLSLLANAGTGMRPPPEPVGDPKASSQAALAELCRQQVMDAYAPAAVLIDGKHECLYSLGPTDRYLRLAPGYPSYDLLAMAPRGLRTKLRSAIQLAGAENRRVVVAGGRREAGGSSMAFNIEVRPVPGDAEQLLLVCFVDQPGQEAKRGRPAASREAPRIAELEHELEATRAEFDGAIRNLEASAEEQKALNEEALSVNEEYQSTNEELLTSKEELQSLNEELTALNGQLQETLERQRTTSNDLQNILYSTDVATIFLDPDLKIRYFTPATRSLFNVIPGDVGRPLSDLNSLAADGALLTDAASVLETEAPVEREIAARTGAWYVRRILPYLTEDNSVEGVVITFVDISERKRTADALEAAERQAQLANAAKSRFLAAASHDLRQPLQALSLMRGVLERKIRNGQTDDALALVARLDETSVAMTGMLNTMLDINQIEAGIVTAKPIDFPIAGLFDRLRDEFSYHAQAKGLVLRVVSSGAVVHSDPHLLEQMIRNLLSNALKYTEHGKVLLGCRRRGNRLRIEICDTGIGVPEDARKAIFDEYHQLDNPVRERSRGLGLGLAIVQRLADMLDHRVEVRSEAGRGSIFAIEVALAEGPADPVLNFHGAPGGTEAAHAHHATILVAEDDPDVRDLLAQLLAAERYRILAAPDGTTALELVERGAVRPDLLLTDYNLPNGFDGLELGTRLRRQLHRDIPIVVLTGDISTGALRHIAQTDCVQLSKPVDPQEMLGVIEHQLASARRAQVAPTVAEAAGEVPATIFVVDDDAQVGAAIRATLEAAGRRVEVYPSCEAFLAAYRPGCSGCLLLDAYLPGMDGLALLRRLGSAGDRLPAIMITGNSDVPMAVAAMKAGAFDFIEKPVRGAALLESIERAMEHSRDGDKLAAWRESAARRVAGLTARERQIMDLVLAGQPSKNIAADLGISQRTVENHRAAVMRKTGSKSLPALARQALAATWKGVAPVDPGTPAAP